MVNTCVDMNKMYHVMCDTVLVINVILLPLLFVIIVLMVPIKLLKLGNIIRDLLFQATNLFSSLMEHKSIKTIFKSPKNGQVSSLKHAVVGTIC